MVFCTFASETKQGDGALRLRGRNVIHFYIMITKMIALNKRETEKEGRGFIQEYPLDEYDSLTQEKRLSKMVEPISQTVDGEKKRLLKSILPYRCPHYTRFVNNHRKGENIIPESFTWQTCIDIDNMEEVASAKKRALELNEQEGMWKDMLLHMDYSPSRKLHIDIQLPVGMTVPEAQRAYCKALGVEPDTTCFTPERFIYITPADYEIYRSEHWYEQLPEEEVAKRRQAYLDRGLTIDGRMEDGRYFDDESQTKEVETPSSTTPSKEFPKDFKGIPYERIIDEYWQRNGGEPTIGERNDKLHRLAANLRAICDNDSEWLLAVMPKLGISEREMRSIIHSACKEPTMGSNKMKEIVDDLLNNNPVEDAPHAGMKMSISKMPIGLKESLKGVPTSMQMPVICAVVPIAAAYADQVEIEYCDNQRQHLGLMSIILGEQASGKSVCKNVVELWKKVFDEEDIPARQREDELKEKNKKRKANEKALDDPHELIRTEPVTVSCSTLLKRLKNAQGHTLYSFGEELDTLVKTNGAGNWSEKYDIYRLSFDRGEWGQDYNSDQAESGVVKVAYNWTMLGTDGAMRKCFRADNIENGLSSRVMVAEMPDSSFAKMPKYGKRSEDDEAKIQEAVTRLRSYSGFVDTPRLREAIEKWVEEKRVEAAKDIDHVKDVYRKRAAVIGFRSGVVFHLLSGAKQENKACLEFALMMAEYVLEQQIKAFGEALQQEYVNAGYECRRYCANHSVFDQLPPVFTVEDLKALKDGHCTDHSLRMIVSRWRRDGWIEKTGSKQWKKRNKGFA